MVDGVDKGADTVNLPLSSDIFDAKLPLDNAFHAAQRLARPHSTGLMASSLGYCLQRNVRSFIEEEPPYDALTLRRFEIGKTVEKLQTNAYYAAGMVVDPPEGEHQWRLYDEEYDVTARLDLLLCWPPEMPGDHLLKFYAEDYIEAVITPLRERIVEKWRGAPEGLYSLELKTTSSASIKNRGREAEPSFAHKIQVGTELWILARHPEQLPGPVNLWRIEYIGKDYAGILPFTIGPDAEAEAGERIAALRHLLENETPWSAVTCECEGWQVPFCPYLYRAEYVFGPRGGKRTSFSCCSGASYERPARGDDDELIAKVAK